MTDTGKISRRTAIKGATGLAASVALGRRLVASSPKRTERSRIPLIHITDLYHPPQDPDDHVDIATIAALPEYDLLGVVLDATRKFLIPKPEGWDIARKPGFVPVAQLAHILGRSIPAGSGPIDPLTSVDDTAINRPDDEQGGIRLLIDLLRRAKKPVTISIVGSGRVLAAAFNREPKLLRQMTRRVLLNAGSTGGPKREWNVGLDPFAYEALWRSGLPIDWYPCGTERSAFDPANERGTYWKVWHKDLFRGLPAPMRAWFCYAFSGSEREDAIRAMDEEVPAAEWARMLEGERNMWSSISLLMGAGRVLAKTTTGWRFVPESNATELEKWPVRLDSIQASVDSEPRVTWELSEKQTSTRIFGRQPGVAYGAAMGEALNALLRGIPCARASA